MVLRRLLSHDVTIMVFSTVIALLIGEMLVRVTAGPNFVLFPRNHAAAQYDGYTLRTMTPDTVFHHQSADGKWRFQTNNKGFRDTRPWQYAKPEGVFRVLVLGDSHTAGFEVQQSETFSAVLERRLNQAGVRAEVMNTGVSGMGTAEQLAYLEHEGVRYKPDAVVVAFFANDYSDNVRSGLFKVEQGELRQTGSTSYVPAVRVIGLMNAIPGVKWLSENSYLFSLALNTVWDFAKSRSLTSSRAEASAGPEVAVQMQAASPREIELAGLLLQRIAGFARQHNMRSVLVDIPSAMVSPFEASVVPPLRSAVARAFDETVWSEDYLRISPPQKAHVPNGHHHINASTHDRIADALSRRLRAKPDDTFLINTNIPIGRAK